MALINCPECQNRISESASSCPNCGHPLTTEDIIEIKKREKRQSELDELNKVEANKSEFRSYLIAGLIVFVIYFMCCGGGLRSCSNSAPSSGKSNWRSHIESDAIPSRAGNGLSQSDIQILWRGAQYMLENGRCDHIDYADKSTSRAGTYFVMDGYKKIYFTEADIR